MDNNKIEKIKARKKQYQALQEAVKSKPLIAVYDDPIEKDGQIRRIGKVKLICYYIERNGGIPLLIPRDANVDELANHVDGFALPGGTAVDPKFYDREKHPETWVHPDKEDERFKLEETFVRNAVKNEKPVLAICRGMQAANVIFGRIWKDEHPLDDIGDRGTLIQYIPEKFGNDGEHRDSNAYKFRPKDTVIWQEKIDKGNKSLPHPFPSSHEIKIVEGSKLAKIAKTHQTGCFSWHNQGVSDTSLAPQLKPTAYSIRKDGSVNYNLVEAAEYKNILLIQSHPETGVANLADGLFSNLVNDAKEYMKTKGQERKIDIGAIMDYYQTAQMVVADLREEAKPRKTKETVLTLVHIKKLRASNR